MSEIVLKMDDLSPDTMDAFWHTYEICRKYSAEASFGVIGSGLETADAGYMKKLQVLSENGIELWNHGYMHCVEEFSENSAEQQRDSILKTQNAFFQAFGYKPCTFGSPYNNSKEITVEVLAEFFPEIKNYFFMADGCGVSTARQLLIRCDCERSTGVMDLEFFKGNYYRMKEHPYLVIQGHPAKWDEAGFLVFEKMVERLKGEGNTFVTASGVQGVRADVNSKMENAFRTFFANHKKNAFYGAGEIARELFRFAAQRSLRPDIFIVSDGQKEVPKVCGLDVRYLSDFLNANRKDEWGIIVAGSGSFQKQIFDKTAKYQLAFWKDYRREEYDRFIDYVRSRIS